MSVYLRFVIDKRDPDSTRRAGLFHAVADLRARELSSEELDEVHRLLSWFGENLAAPRVLVRGRASPAAICWFYDSAVEHIARMRALARLFDQHAIFTHVLKSRRPGYVVYQDAYQVAAIPFRETAT